MTRVLRSEWTKLRTVRATVWTPAVGFAAVPVLAAVVALTGSLQPDDTVFGASLTGAVIGQLAMAVLGVLVMSAEYGTGMVRTTFVATPHRHAVLAAKATAVAAVAFAGGLPASTAAYVTGRVLLAGEGYPPGEPVPALFGVALCFSVAALIGLAACVVLRHTAGALTVALGAILLPAMLGPVLGSWGRWVVAGAPATAVQKLSQSSDLTPDVAGSLGAWPTLLLVCGYTVAALAVAGRLLRTRDA
jgi:ABC-2 type transport system permease protein